ncbi:MAG TPA: DUF6431 domain-containing protein [Thermotogota bacterium]|nr:DUF6431 domain-containing protein [Thermotogota bacterium]
MQIIHDFGINYLAYHRRGKNNAYPEIEQCAYCKDRLLKNGYYQRYMISFSKTYRIFIRRYRCRHCQRSLSVLPSFLLPRMQYLLTVIVIRLLRYLEHKPILLDMRNLFFHLKRFKKNIGGVIMFLREHLPPADIPLQDQGIFLNCLKQIEKINPFVFSKDYFMSYGCSFMSR